MDAIVEALMLEHRPGWIGWLRREFAPSFGRDTATARMVITVVIVTIISLALQVPQLPFSAFFVFFVSKENRVLTAMTGIVMIIGTTTAIAASLFLFRFSFDYPEIRILVIAGFVFTGMFLSRTFVIGPLGFVIGFFTALIQTITEAAPNTEVLVRTVLYLWVAIVYPIAITVVINQILLPARPWEALGTLFTRRLGATTTALQRLIKEGTAGGQTNPPLMELATRGNSAMLTLLHFSEVQDPPMKHRHDGLLSTICATEHLLVATAAMEFRQPTSVSETDRLAAQSLVDEIKRLETAITRIHPVLPPPAEPEIVAELPQLHELQLAARELRESLTKESVNTAAPPPARKPLFIPDAFTNPAHVRFALKVTLAAMVCYLIYSGLQWPGISTSFVTCCFVALENTGATVRKSLLRLIGCALGGLAGFLAIMYLVPHMEGIVSLVLLVAVFSAVAGWVSAGGERVAYAGLQAAFAFYLCLFQGFAPETNFTIVRDRVVGIFIGIIVASIVFHFIWPERAIDSLRTRFIRLLRSLSRLLVFPSLDSSMETERKKAFPIRREIIEDMDSSLRLSELAGMEHAIIGSTAGLSPVRMEQMVARSQMVFLMSVVLLEQIKLEEWQRLSQPAREAELNLRNRASEHLQDVARYVEGGPAPRPQPLQAAWVAWEAVVPPETVNDRVRLMRRVAEQVQEIN